jgi:hypothetical protein
MHYKTGKDPAAALGDYVRSPQRIRLAGNVKADI